VTRHTSEVIYHTCTTALVLLHINQQMEFEVLSFTNSKDMIRANCLKIGHETLTAPIKK